MTKVVGLHGRIPIEPNGCDPEIVDLLEDCLDRARSGELKALGVLMVCRDGHLFTTSRGRSHKHEMVACCEYLKHDLCAS